VNRVRNLAFADGGGRELALDLYVPTNVEKPPLVLWIHGGGWIVGDKRKCRTCWLVPRGYAVANVNYRLLKTAIYPAQIHDVKAAIRWLRANQEKYGYDASRIGATGASAGGHLAALLGTSADVEELEGSLGKHTDRSSRVQAVVSISGFSDIATSYAANPAPRIVKLLGGTPDEKPEKSDLASPVRFVGAGDAPLLLVHGADDPIVDPQQAVQLHRAYEEAGLDSSLVMIPETKHQDLDLRDPKLQTRTDEFLAENLKR